MSGGTLVISRAVNNHVYYKKSLEDFGFPNVTPTDLEKDALNSLIYDIKPKHLLIGARFYQCSTPYMMGELAKRFPKINMAAFSFEEYPAELAMYFIFYGVKSYVSKFDGIDQWYKGLADIRDGKEYISPAVQQRIDSRTEYPKHSLNISKRQKEVILLTCNGFKEVEIADLLHISRRTVDTHKREIFTMLNVRSANELIRAALTLEMVKLEEMYFYPKDYVLKPSPDRVI
jgi:DNA-binding NarL/FixJ family response regulator